MFSQFDFDDGKEAPQFGQVFTVLGGGTGDQ